MIRQANASRGNTTDNEEVIGEGSKVEAKYKGGSKYYKGKITRKRLNGTFDILYDDGESEERVAASLIRSLGRGVRRDDKDVEDEHKKEETYFVGAKVDVFNSCFNSFSMLKL
jgi:hypothetical protein